MHPDLVVVLHFLTALPVLADACALLLGHVLHPEDCMQVQAHCSILPLLKKAMQGRIASFPGVH